MTVEWFINIRSHSAKRYTTGEKNFYQTLASQVLHPLVMSHVRGIVSQDLTCGKVYVLLVYSFRDVE